MSIAYSFYLLENEANKQKKNKKKDLNTIDREELFQSYLLNIAWRVDSKPDSGQISFKTGLKINSITTSKIK
jgi:hypothetical protein